MLSAVEALAKVDAFVLSAREHVFGHMGGADLCTSDADLQDGFYRMSVPRFASWFGVLEHFRAGDSGVSIIWKDDLGERADVDAEVFVFPVTVAMVMGWSWASFFCNEICAQVALECCPRLAGLVCFSQPTPTL